MNHKTFAEYLDRKAKVQTEPKVKTIADYDGPVDKNPPKSEKAKDAGGSDKKSDKPSAYKVQGDKDPNKGKLKDGFAKEGDKKLKYEPDTKVTGKKSSWPKTKTQEWVDRTKDMTLAEFTKKIRDEANQDCKEDSFKAVQEVISVCKCNKKNVSNLVREMKRNGLFGKLIKEVAQHPETFKALAILMERDETYAKRLVSAMNEMVGPPMGNEGGDAMPPLKKKKSPLDHLGKGHPHDDLGMGGDDDDDLGMGSDDDMGDDDLGMEDDLDSDHDDMMGDKDLGDESGEDLDSPMKAPHDKIMPPKKKKHAHDHLLGAMKSNPMMGAAMKGMMGAY